ncbi:MAG: IPT/TIG domain-containing protein [Hyphomicrobiales bacterium]|nr:IPT/TIG domain-containing protein [Hyphomicrobiales bacterium]
MSGAGPSITDISPVAGPAGTAVTIKGSGFSNTIADNFVTLAGALMIVASATPTTLVAAADITVRGPSLIPVFKKPAPLQDRPPVLVDVIGVN